MAERKVIAYCMHEREFAAVSPLMKDPAWTASYAVGSMDDAAIKALEDQGIIVEIVDAEPAAGLPATRRRELRPADAGPADLVGDPLPPALHPTKDNVFVVAINGPVLLEEWRQGVEALGVRLIEKRPGNQYTARLSLARVGQLRALPFVADVHLLSPDETTGRTFTPAGRRTRGFGAAPPRKVAFDVLLHAPDDLDDVQRWLVDHGITILASGRRKIRVELAAESPHAREIQALPGVAEIQEYVPPTLANERARRLLGLTSTMGAAVLPHTGAGEVVGVADSGLDAAHAAFTGKLQAVIPRGRPADASDPHGHGTHVAGSVLGDGVAASAGAGGGVAPGAQLVFQSIMDAQGRLGGLPVDLSELFDEAYQAGARIHNNSWSADTKSFYTFSSREVDEFVFDHPDMLVVIAAGNEGSARDPFNAPVGFVDWQSIGSPATAKNALTVGASRSDRAAEGQSQSTYKQFDARRFPDPPIGTETISGNPECLAAFSGRGPCDSSRIKPDLVAPGTDILSARASTAPAQSFWGLPADPALAAYGYMGGTSMAAPLVAGCAALVRQYYRNDRAADPSAAVLKATLVNSTKWLSGPDATADHQKVPNYHQGFGAVFMPHAIPNVTEPWMQLAFIDTWKDQPRQLAGTGDRRRFAFQVTGGAFLRLCLAWTDPPPGPGLQNTLAVILEGPLNPPKVPGNHDRPRRIDPVDRDNNVQIVRIENPPPGNYLAIVFARNMLRPPQDYALVVTGALSGGLMEV